MNAISITTISARRANFRSKIYVQTLTRKNYNERKFSNTTISARCVNFRSKIYVRTLTRKNYNERYFNHDH